MRDNTAITIDDFRIPSNEGYDPDVHKAMMRRTHYSLSENQHVVGRRYCIDGMTYHVNSIFDPAAKKTVIDDVKHLIDGELNKVS